MPSPSSDASRASAREGQTRRGSLSRRELARRRRMFARRRAGAVAMAVLLIGGTVAGVAALNRPSAASAGPVTGAASSAVAAVSADVNAVAVSTLDSLRESTVTKAERALARYSDASRETEDALFDAVAALKAASSADLPDALASVAAARTAVIDDARAYRSGLIDDSAAQNTQPTGGDVDAQLTYLMTYVFDYNTDWGDYNPYGGDCTNFASQGLLARGWKIDDTWYSDGGMWTASKPWIATAAMAAYFDSLGLSYSTQDDLDRVRVGDVGLFDWGETGVGYDHTMTVSKVEYTPDGPVISFVSHNHDGKYRELQQTLYTEHTDSTVRIYHIP